MLLMPANTCDTGIGLTGNPRGHCYVFVAKITREYSSPFLNMCAMLWSGQKKYAFLLHTFVLRLSLVSRLPQENISVCMCPYSTNTMCFYRTWDASRQSKTRLVCAV